MPAHPTLKSEFTPGVSGDTPNSERGEFLYLDTETAQLLGLAYDRAIASAARERSDQDIPVNRIRDLIAMELVECARAGERDPKGLEDRALRALAMVTYSSLLPGNGSKESSE